jgi:hypothetical protein
MDSLPLVVILNGLLFLLLDDLDGAFGTLHLASSTDEAVINIYYNRFFVFKFENFDRTNIDACFASGAFLVVNYNFYHSGTQLRFLDFNKKNSFK